MKTTPQIALGCLLALVVSAPAAARSINYAFVCDSSFNTIAQNHGYPACSDMIREEFVKKGIQFINDNTSADTGATVYYLSGSWSSPSWGSPASDFLASVDAYSGYEEQGRWYFKIGFTGRRMDGRAGLSGTTWRSGGLARNAVISYYEPGGGVNSNWATTALHELTHLLRDDGFHHETDGSSSVRTCAMDAYDYSGQNQVHQICAYCRGQVNRISAGWVSLTNRGGPAALGTGSRQDASQPGQSWRFSERYWGLRNIDNIAWQQDASGTDHIYVMGWHALDAAEYRMDLGYSGSNNDLGLTGKADRPGPVTLNVYNDGHFDGTFLWDNNNNINETTWKQIYKWPANGSRHIGVEFVLDAYTGPGDGDRNLYLDALGVW